MDDFDKIYIGGQWVLPSGAGIREIVDPYSETVIARVRQADAADTERAVFAAREAFPAFSVTTPSDRAALIDRIIAAYEKRLAAFAEVIAREAGIPIASKGQVTGPIEHMKVVRDLLGSYPFEARLGKTIVRREAIGVCALISPWNWPLQTPIVKFVYAMAAGCTSVVKPSDVTPLSAILLAEVMHEAQVPPGVFNLVTGKGSIVGETLCAHPQVDLISFTGSTSAGARVGAVAARTVKRTVLELGGKSASLVLPDADLEHAARWNIQRCFFNTGQSCHAPSRMLVHESQVAAVLPLLADEASRFVLGDPRDPATTMGPAASADQWEAVQQYIRAGSEEGAQLVCGGLGRPHGLPVGFFVRPTVFARVDPGMVIAREEIFGPVVAVIPYSSEEQALAIANDTIFGLGGYVFTSDAERGYRIASELKAGRVSFNGATTNSVSPMGGYKQSGIGRSMGVFGLEEYLEIKAVYGFEERAACLPEVGPGMIRERHRGIEGRGGDRS